jgi:hypothetical protein
MSSQELDRMLAALREQMRGAGAPDHVETALRLAFRAQSRKPARRVWIAWTAGAAATIAVVIGAALWSMAQPGPALPVIKLAIAPPPPTPLQPTARKIEHAAVPKRTTRAPRARVEPVNVESAKRETTAAPEIATDFLPIEDTAGLPPIESGHILRVRLPQATVMGFGFPINPDRIVEPVKADVLFGQDGIARAVRFVR